MILDIILIALFVFMMLYGYKKGCIGIVAKLVSLIIAFILAYFLAETIGGYIAETDFGGKIAESIESTVVVNLNNAQESSVISFLQDKLELADESSIMDKILNYVFTGIGFVCVFVVVRIVLWIAQKILENIFELPVLKTFNKLGGVIASTVLFLIEVSILLAVIKSISSLDFMQSIVKIVQSSVITKTLYDHNIITTLILSKIV